MFYSMLDTWLGGIGFFFGILSSLATQSYHTVLVYWANFLKQTDVVTVYFTATNFWNGDIFYFTNFQFSSDVLKLVSNILDFFNDIIVTFLGTFGELLGVSELPFVLGLAIVILVVVFCLRMVRMIKSLF